jgi:hypothetical protein
LGDQEEVVSLPQRMISRARRRFGRDVEIICDRCSGGGYFWSVRVRGQLAVSTYDKKRRVGQLMLHDALDGLAKAADSRVGKKSALNDNAYSEAST